MNVVTVMDRLCVVFALYDYVCYSKQVICTTTHFVLPTGVPHPSRFTQAKRPLISVKDTIPSQRGEGVCVCVCDDDIT